MGTRSPYLWGARTTLSILQMGYSEEHDYFKQGLMKYQLLNTLL